MYILWQDILRDVYPDFQRVEKFRQFLFLGDDIAWNVHIDDALYFGAYHAQYALVHIGAFKHGAAVSIDDLALPGDHIVVIDHIFTEVEVLPFYPSLRLYYHARDHATFQRHILIHAREFHDL